MNKCVCEERSEGHEYDPAFDVNEASPINPHVRLLVGRSVVGWSQFPYIIFQYRSANF